MYLINKRIHNVFMYSIVCNIKVGRDEEISEAWFQEEVEMGRIRPRHYEWSEFHAPFTILNVGIFVLSGLDL